MVQSMSRKGDCWDNAVAESFFATLEHELLAGNVFASHREANIALVEFIEHWYNTERQHSTSQYQSPQQYEQRSVEWREQRKPCVGENGSTPITSYRHRRKCSVT